MTLDPAVATAPADDRPDRSVLVIGGLIAVLVVAAVVAALTLGNRPPASYPPDSPAAAFQTYARAVQERQVEVAYGLFSKRVQGIMTLEQYQKEYARPVVSRDRSSRLRIDRVEQTGERATLYLTTEYVSGSGLDSNRSTFTQQVELIREGGAWKIDERLGWQD